MLKILTAFLNLSINRIVLLIFFLNFFFTYIRISKKSSTKFYQINKENLQKEKKKNAYERYQNLSKEVKEKKAIIWS